MLDPTPKDSTTPTNTPKSTPLILVCYHKFSTPIIASEILRPIIVGAANMGDGAKALQEKLSRDSALGNHSGDFVDFRATADHKSSSALKSTKSTTSNTATPRILEEESQTRSEKTAASKKVDSRICDEKCGLQGKSQGSYLDGNDRRDFSPLPHLSRKAESPVLRDDSGDNISHLNPHFCELTAMYWAWKNVDSSYYGLFHYRRILDLSPKAQHIRTDYPIFTSSRRYNPKRYGLTSQNITKLLQEYDIILPQGYKNHYPSPCDEGLDNYGIYAHYHYAKDLDRIIELIKSRHPEMQAALESTLFTKPPRWHIANMFIMRKDLYNEYCQWLFSLLFDLSKETDLSDYTPYQARIYGFLSERMFNIWLTYQRHAQTLRILEAPMILFMKSIKPLIGWEINEKYKRFYLFGLRLYKKRVNPKN